MQSLVDTVLKFFGKRESFQDIFGVVPVATPESQEIVSCVLYRRAQALFWARQDARPTSFRSMVGKDLPGVTGSLQAEKERTQRQFEIAAEAARTAGFQVLSSAEEYNDLGNWRTFRRCHR